MFIRQRYGILIPETAWQLDAVPNHLRPRFEITGKEGITVVAGRDLEALRAKFQEREIPVEQGAWEKAVQKLESYDITTWSIGDLPEQVEVTDVAGIPLLGFPGLEVDDGHVNLRLFRSPGAAELATLPGMQRLGELALERELAWAQRDLRALESVKPLYVTLGPVEVLQSSAFEHLKQHLFQPPSLVPLIEANYRRMIELARERLPGSVNKLIESTAQILRLRQELLVHKKPYPALRTDLDALVPPRFLQVYSPALLQHLPRYLKALLVRTERAALNPAKDQERARQVQPYALAVAELEKAAPKVLAKQKALSDLRWMVEEYKVSLFAQELGTAQPVSAKRLDRQLELARG
jgi:ATP-dependent helicase HrpA